MCSCGQTILSTKSILRPFQKDGITRNEASSILGVSKSNDCKSCNLIGIGNYCGRTEKEKIAEAHRRMNTRIYFQGITLHGYQEPILESINTNPKYSDANVGKPQISSFLPNESTDQGTIDYERVAENFRTIDVYSGLVDGKNYGRFNRLRQHKIRHTRHPYGTEKRFCIPVTNNINYGWWTRDIEHLNKTKWYEAREKAPIVRGDITKFLDEMFHHDPSFIFF